MIYRYGSVAASCGDKHIQYPIATPKFFGLTGLKRLDYPPAKGVMWSDGTGDSLVFGPAGQEENAKPEKMKDMHAA